MEMDKKMFKNMIILGIAAELYTAKSFIQKEKMGWHNGSTISKSLCCKTQSLLMLFCLNY